MTGQEILEGLSFVDERYIAEAETANLRRNTPWMKWVSVAACLCILITGVYAYSQMQHKGAMESMAAPEAAAPQAVPEAAPEAAPREEEIEAEAAPEPPAEAEEAPIPADELQQIPYARLRVINVAEDGFEAIVEEVSDEPSLFEIGMQVTVIIDPDKTPGGREQADSTVADKQKLQEDLLIQIEDGAYDAGLNILYVAGVLPTD